MSLVSLQTSEHQSDTSTLLNSSSINNLSGINQRETPITLPQVVRVRAQNGKKLNCEFELTSDRFKLVQTHQQALDMDTTVSGTPIRASPLYWFFWCQLRSMMLVGKHLRIKVNHMNRKIIFWCKFVDEHEARLSIQTILSHGFIRKWPLSLWARLHHQGALKFVGVTNRAQRASMGNVHQNIKSLKSVDSFSPLSATQIYWASGASSTDVSCSTPNNPKYASQGSLHKSILIKSVRKTSEIKQTPSGSIRSMAVAIDEMQRPYSSLFDTKPTDPELLTELDYSNILLYRLLDIDYANKERYQQLYSAKYNSNRQQPVTLENN